MGKMFLQLYYKLVFVVSEGEIEQAEKLLKECMESVMKLDVFLVAN